MSGDGGSAAASPVVPEQRFAPTRRVFDNGLTLLHQANHSSPAVSVSLVYPAGAALETDRATGLAALTARLLTCGTEHRTKAEIGEELDHVGAHLNGGAGRHTASIAAKARAEDFETVLDLIADCARRPVFPEHEVERRRRIALTSIRERYDDPAWMAVDTFRRLVYSPDHPYSWRLQGDEESVGALRREQMEEFHAEHCRPGAAALVVVGDVGLDKVTRAVERLLGTWIDPDERDDRRVGLRGSLPAIADAPPPPATIREAVVMPAKSQADIAVGHPGPRRDDPDYHAAVVMNTILGRFAMGGRLGSNVREEQGLAYYTYSALQAGPGPGPFLVRAGVHPDHVEAALEAIVSELERITSEPVDERELDDARFSLVRSVPRTLEQNEGMAGLMMHMELYDLGFDYLDRYPALVEAVDVDAVLRVARRILRPNALGVAVAGPEAGGAP